MIVKEVRGDACLQRASPEATLAAQLAFVDQLSLKQKGNADLIAMRLFTDSELDYFTAALVLYSDLGWPLAYKEIRKMMEGAGRKWRQNDEFSVCITYVRDFVKGRPELAAAKTANIDPLRTKKASPQVPVMLPFWPYEHVSTLMCVCVVTWRVVLIC